LFKKIKASIRVPDGRELMVCDVANQNDVRNTILSMVAMNK
jgi:hypothetical protein